TQPVRSLPLKRSTNCPVDWAARVTEATRPATRAMVGKGFMAAAAYHGRRTPYLSCGVSSLPSSKARWTRIGDVSPGDTVGHYQILDALGKGGMGEVFLAQDTRLQRRVALKVLPPTFATDPAHRERFEREARAVAALNHPNIVTIHSVE